MCVWFKTIKMQVLSSYQMSYDFWITFGDYAFEIHPCEYNTSTLHLFGAELSIIIKD